MYASRTDEESLLPRQTSRDMWLSKWVPRIALIVSICAFIFQTTVLYPWHLELSAEFAQLASQVKNATGK
jgi:hypothetical protein